MSFSIELCCVINNRGKATSTLEESVRHPLYMHVQNGDIAGRRVCVRVVGVLFCLFSAAESIISHVLVVK